MNFEFTDDSKLKKKWISYVGTRWRGFKSQLTVDYIRKPKSGLARPWIRYSFISKKQWKKFVRVRRSEELKVSTSLIYRIILC